MPGETILVVDDDAHIVQLVRMYLEREGYQVHSAADGLAALESVQALNPALLVLDIMLPGLDGLEVCRRLRANDNPVTILMLTARDEDIDKIIGLELGADDYLTKPFNPRELTARVKALLRLLQRSERLTRPAADQPNLLKIGDLAIDLDGRSVSLNGGLLSMRHQEFNLLRVFAEHKNMVLTREQLLNLAWGYDFYGQTRTVDVHVGHLRRKLASSRVKIETVTSDGYKLVVISDGSKLVP
jgi:DNA-binding response OmpR family regulator